MAKKHLHRIIINRVVKGKPDLIYNFGSTKNIEIRMADNAAIIDICLSEKKTPEDLITFQVKQFRDALRKVYLKHVLQYGKDIFIKRIMIEIDGEKTKYDKSYSNFPFMFSMINIPKEFQLNTCEEDLLNQIICATKSKQDGDKRYACLYAFLCGLGREYYIDQFTNLWTAMNAFYNRLAELFDQRIKGDNRFAENEGLLKKLTFYHKDEMGVDAMTSLFGKSWIVDKLDTELSEVEIIHFMSDYFSKCQYDEYEEILKDSNESNSEKIQELEIFANKMGRDGYSWLLFRFPYIVRCNLLHGNRVSPVIAGYNDPEIVVLKALSHILREFLNDNLFWLFKNDSLSDEDYEVLLKFVANYSTVNLNSKQSKYLQDLGYLEISLEENSK